LGCEPVGVGGVVQAMRGDGVSDERDRAIIGSVARALAASAGTCKHCGCHGDSCSLREGERCAWIDKYRNVCSNTPCVLADIRSKRKYRRKSRGRAA